MPRRLPRGPDPADQASRHLVTPAAPSQHRRLVTSQSSNADPGRGVRPGRRDSPADTGQATGSRNQLADQNVKAFADQLAPLWSAATVFRSRSSTSCSYFARVSFTGTATNGRVSFES